jgi:FkbM family methyltransferase
VIGYVRRKLDRYRARRTFREYGYEVRRFELEREGVVDYAQWLHPFETPKTFTQADVDGLRTFIREGDTAIDVGAHTGDTTVPIALACGSSGLVVALEPNPYVFKVLEANARLNTGRTSIHPVNVAATATDGTYVFHYWDASFGNGGNLSTLHNQRHGHRYPLRVTGRNLDAYVRAHFADRLARLSYIKTDAEGYDKDVLKSIAGLLRDARPAVVSEVHRKLDRAERDQLLDVFDDVGYRVHRFNGGAAPVGEPVTRDDVYRADRLDVVALPGELTGA